LEEARGECDALVPGLDLNFQEEVVFPKMSPKNAPAFLAAAYFSSINLSRLRLSGSRESYETFGVFRQKTACLHAVCNKTHAATLRSIFD